MGKAFLLAVLLCMSLAVFTSVVAEFGDPKAAPYAVLIIGTVCILFSAVAGYACAQSEHANRDDSAK